MTPTAMVFSVRKKKPKCQDLPEVPAAQAAPVANAAQVAQVVRQNLKLLRLNKPGLLRSIQQPQSGFPVCG